MAETPVLNERKVVTGALADKDQLFIRLLARK